IAEYAASQISRTVRIELRAPSWAECVFHVLAHVELSGLPSSLFSPWYVRFAEATLGPASRRPLGEDVVALSACLRDHTTLATVQNLAFLWKESEGALTCAATELGELRDVQVTDVRLLASLRAHAGAVELVRCAALLEADACARLPVTRPDAVSFQAALSALVPHAPELAHA